MSDHEKQTYFLRQCLRYDESVARQTLEAGIVQLQCDLRCIGHAIGLMAVNTALALAGLTYASIFVDHFPDNIPHFIALGLCALGLGSFICLIVFVVLGLVYRQKLDLQREECRLLIVKLLESRLGSPAESLKSQTPRVASQGNGASPNIPSAAVSQGSHS